MSARSCQLCGKALSRFSVGADGDFCSREHRNQYRLRQGMDRLQEANKVANVMRRREHLRPLPGSSLANGTTTLRRGFFKGKFTMAAKPMVSTARVGVRPTPLRITAKADQFIAHKPTQAAQAAPRVETKPTLAGRRRPEIAQRRLRKLSTQMKPAGGVKSNLLSAPRGKQHREFGISLPAVKRPQCKRLEISKRTSKLTGAQVLTKLNFTAPTGKALRVSSACGFRPRSQKRTFTPMDAKISAKMRWREKTLGKLVAKHPPKPQKQGAGPIAIQIGGLFAPASPSPSGTGTLARRKPVEVRKPAALRGSLPAARLTEVQLTPLNGGLSFPDVEFAQWKPGKRDALPHVSKKPPAVTGRGTSKTLLAPFVPQDLQCGYNFNVGQNGGKDQKR